MFFSSFLFYGMMKHILALYRNAYFTKDAITFVKSEMSPSTLAFSNAFIYSSLRSTGMTIQLYPPNASMTFKIKRPILPFPSIYG